MAPTDPKFSAHLSPSNAEVEAEKRAKRAARFGTTPTTTDDATKVLDRQKKFGTTEKTDAGVSALDRALPERAVRKRGRKGVDDDGNDDAGANKRRDSRKRKGRGAGGGNGSAAADKDKTPATAPAAAASGRVSKEQATKDKAAAESRRKKWASKLGDAQ